MYAWHGPAEVATAAATAMPSQARVLTPSTAAVCALVQQQICLPPDAIGPLLAHYVPVSSFLQEC